MKKNYFFAILIVFGITNLVNAQLVSTVDDLSLSPESYWNGSDGSGSFTSGFASYINHYNSSWGVWSGFSYSNITDNITTGYMNQYSSITGKGATNTANYVVGYGADTIRFSSSVNLDGVYVTNSTYAYFDMLNGSSFSKKFDVNDWFKLTIKGFDSNKNKVGETDFYLADFRFTDISKNYILNSWEWVDLSAFSNVAYITFERSSSDNGSWGMNTPDYFCLDELKITTSTENIKIEDLKSQVFEKDGEIIVSNNNGIEKVGVFDLSGRVIYSQFFNSSNDNQVVIPVNNSGMFIVKITINGVVETKKVVVK